MIEMIGGYDSWQFIVLVIILLFGGSILNGFTKNVFVRFLGLMLFMFGGVLLTSYTSYTVTNTPNLPPAASVFPIIFVAILLLTVVKMFQFGTPDKKNEQTPTQDVVDTAKK